MSDTSAPDSGETLAALLHETRRFEPPAELAAQANAQPGIYQAAAADPPAWWAEQAERLTWDYHWQSVLEWDLPYARWFVGGRLNAAYNCVDRHVEVGRGDNELPCACAEADEAERLAGELAGHRYTELLRFDGFLGGREPLREDQHQEHRVFGQCDRAELPRRVGDADATSQEAGDVDMVETGSEDLPQQ